METSASSEARSAPSSYPTARQSGFCTGMRHNRRVYVAGAIENASFPEEQKNRRVSGELRKNRPSWRSKGDLNPRDPSISPSCSVVSIRQAMNWNARCVTSVCPAVRFVNCVVGQCEFLMARSSLTNFCRWAACPINMLSALSNF